MPIQSDVISELRTLFEEGATPSRLIRHIVARHPQETNWHALIQEYFKRAFGVDIVRGLESHDDYSHPDLRHAFLNRETLHEMIQKKGSWRQDAEDDAADSAWLNSLSATNIDTRLKQAEKTVLPELSSCWHKLTDSERFAIQRLIAGYNGESETVQILARLVECLQKQIDDLEK